MREPLGRFAPVQLVAQHREVIVVLGMQQSRRVRRTSRGDAVALGIPQEAQKAAAVLGRNYPGSEWYQRAYKLVNRHVPQTAPQS